MKNPFKKSKQYSNISEPVSDLDPQRMASLKSRNYSDLDPEVMRKIQQSHLNKNSFLESSSASSSSSSSPSNSPYKNSVSRTNSSTTHATMPSTDQTEHSSTSQKSVGSRNATRRGTNASFEEEQHHDAMITSHSTTTLITTTTNSAKNVFPAPPGSPIKSKRTLFLMKKKQATTTNSSTSAAAATTTTSTSTSHKSRRTTHHHTSKLQQDLMIHKESTQASTSTNGSKKSSSSLQDNPTSLKSSPPRPKQNKVLSALFTSNASPSIIPVTPDTNESLKNHGAQNSSTEYDNEEIDAFTDAPTEFFHPSYLFQDEHDPSREECLNDRLTDESPQTEHTAWDPHQVPTKNNGSKHKTFSLSHKDTTIEDDTPPPPPTKRLSGFRKRAPTPPPFKQKKSSTKTLKEGTKRHREKNHHDIGTSSTCSDLDKTFDPEIVSVSSDITSPTFQPLDSTSTPTGSGDTPTSTSWREKIHSSFKTCAHNEMGAKRSSSSSSSSRFWETFVDGLCSSKPMKTVNVSSDHEDEVHVS